MAITADSLRWYQSERMTDEDDGGGRLTGTEIVWGAENQIFDDLSDVDRAAGDVSIRKVYASVASTSDDKYLDAGVVVLKPPDDPDVSVVAFSTGDYYDERKALATRMESSIVRGGLYIGYLWGDHIIGQRAVVLWQRLSTDLPVVGQRLELVARASSTTTHSQVLWITRIIEETIERTDAQGLYQVRQVVCEIAEPLLAGYTGCEPTRIDPTTQSANGTLIYETRYNPDAVATVGVSPLTESASLGDFSLKVESLYSPLIPTAFAETPLADVNPGGETATLVPASDGTVTWSTTTDTVGPGKSLYVGGPVMPGGFSLVVSGSTITDSGGLLKLGTADIGTIDYSNGVCVWTSACPAYGTANKTITYKPAAVPMRVADTASQAVLLENRGFVWVITLAPIPSPGSLRVAYRANNAWYALMDKGDGNLRGTDSSYGSGSINFTTGTVTVTTGALPDPESEIMFSWATPVSYQSRAGEPVDAPVINGQTANTGVRPGTVWVTWTVGGTTITLRDDAEHGKLQGIGGYGEIRYNTGQWWVRPTTLPPMGTAFDITYSFGDPIEEVFDSPLRDGGGSLELTLSSPPLAGSVEVSWPVEILDFADQVGVEETLIPKASDPRKINWGKLSGPDWGDWGTL